MSLTGVSDHSLVLATPRTKTWSNELTEVYFMQSIMVTIAT